MKTLDRVLIVEDNDADRRLAVRVLRKVWPNARILEARNGKEAIEALGRCGNHIVEPVDRSPARRAFPLRQKLHRQADHHDNRRTSARDGRLIAIGARFAPAAHRGDAGGGRGDATLGRTLGDTSLPAGYALHAHAAKVLLALIVLHAAGALANHYWFRTDVLRKMLPDQGRDAKRGSRRNARG